MSQFLNNEAEESEDEEELSVHERKKLRQLKAAGGGSSEEEEDDDERLREELKDLIDDDPIEEDDGSDDDEGGRSGKKRKREENWLEDDDFDLIEENLGVKVNRKKRFKRLLRQDNDSDGEEELVDEFDGDNEVDEDSDEGDYESDPDDFIVDDNDQPITERKKKRPSIFSDACLQESQDIFGVDFDYDEFSKYEDDSDGYDYDDEFVDGGEERVKKKGHKKKGPTKTIFDIYEPSELRRGFFTDLDNEIRMTDIPERMQLREVPVTPVPEGSLELDEEAEWIYRFAFCKKTVSEQEKGGNRKNLRMPETAISKIKQTLDFIRNQHMEVPFIAFYRKEYVKPELNIDDLWQVYYFDGRWCQLIERKRKLKALFEKMRTFQLDTLCADLEKPLPDDIRLIQDSDFERLADVQSMEELKDVHVYFLLNYSHELPLMQAEQRRKLLQERSEAMALRQAASAENGAEGADGAAVTIQDPKEGGDPTPVDEQLKPALNNSQYTVFRKAGFCGFAKHFGLTPEQFAENLRDNYQRNEVTQVSLSPTELAKNYLSPRFRTVDDVLHGVKYVVARQLALEPLLRKTVREVYFDRARINIRPTKNGKALIDETSPVYPMKYVAKKPVSNLFGDQFIKLLMAEEEKLLEVTFLEEFEGNVTANGSPGDYVEEAMTLYHLDQFSKHVLEWNVLRGECVNLALKKWVIPDLIKELRATLHEEAQQFVLRCCTAKLYKWLQVAPYKPEIPPDYSYEEWGSLLGIRVLSLAYDTDLSVAAFCAVTTVEGDISDYLRLPHILKRKYSYNAEEKSQKLNDLRKLKDFIKMKKPHVVVIGAESRDALAIQTDIREILKELETSEEFPPIEVELIDNQLAKIYANSKKGESDFKEYPAMLKQAISLARKMHDPLVEYSQLCNADDDILCLRYHPLQERVPREQLLEKLSLEFINRTNEVGVDINLMVQSPRTVNLLQYICGLGPRKGQWMLRMLKLSTQRLENRNQLVTSCHLGPTIFINCSGFIKIDTASMGYNTESYVEVLDGSRVHPETYEWARKMASDAVDAEDDMNSASALDEILESPERLKDLDLDTFAKDLERQGFGSKNITLYNIRDELSCMYKDHRTPYTKPRAEELFDMLTKETPNSFYVGKCVTAMVTGFTYRRPQGEQLDNANPVRIEASGHWQCPFCRKADFPELSEVWIHFDSNKCLGQAFGVRVRLENGLPGFIHIRNLCDRQVRSPEDHVRVSQAIHVRIIRIDIERFSVNCSAKTADLNDVNNEWRPRRDAFYDFVTEEQDNQKAIDAKTKALKSKTYTRRVIAHPSFFNKTYAEVVAMLAQAEQGEVALRPSSKATDHLTATWKVADDIFQHIDVREENKENEYSLGRSLWIGTEQFEDLDEIIARYITPMALAARELIQYKYYKPNTTPVNGNEYNFMERILLNEQKRDPMKIHYFFTASRNIPGQFLLSYIPKTNVMHEYVTVTPEGYRFRSQVFHSVNSLVCWFKEHWQDPTASPAMNSLSGSSSTPYKNSHSMRPPGSVSGSKAPYSITGSISSSGGGDSSGYTKARTTVGYGSLPIGSAAATTAYYGGSSTPWYGGNTNTTPYTPSGQTPFMTPYTPFPTPYTPFPTPYTPHASQTPRYSHGVLSPTSQSSSSQQGHYGGSGRGVTPRYETSGSGRNSISNYNTPSYNYQRDKVNLKWPLPNDFWTSHQQQQQEQPIGGIDMALGLEMSSGGGGVEGEGGYGKDYSSSSNTGHDASAVPLKSSLRSTPGTSTSPY
ncbi:hypothetical protein KR026_009703 [Drosophila bipectinata]|nr:hypothetical protein KR026_009703 [Drosophila bipectinata]